MFAVDVGILIVTIKHPAAALPPPQFPEMDSIAQGEKRMSSKVVFFLIQNAGLLSGFTIILMITMFAGQINLGE